MTPLDRHSAKVMLLGDIGVGKTSLAKRLVFDRFEGQYKTTIGVEILTYDIQLSAACNNATMRLVLWDTDGDFGEAIFSSMYLTGALGALVVADATRPESFARMNGLLRGLATHLPGRPSAALVNKIDLIDPGFDMPDLAGLRKEEMARTSALTGEGVVPVFQMIAEAIWRRAR